MDPADPDPQDYAQLTAQEMADLMERILREGNYTTLVLDIGDYGRDALPLLEKCQVVYAPIREDPFSAEKMREFEEYLETTGNNAVAEKIQKIHADDDRREKDGTFSTGASVGRYGRFCQEPAERTEELMGQLKKILREQILAEMTYERQMSDEEIADLIDRKMDACLEEQLGEFPLTLGNG